nr:hypothetical protein [Tanacetum cinerariifolium]
IDEDDMEDIDIKWNMALLSMRADRFWKKTGKKITIQGTDVAGFDKSKVECFNCHKMGHLARECMAPRSQDRGRKDNYRQGSNIEEQAPKALMAIDGAVDRPTENKTDKGETVKKPAVKYAKLYRKPSNSSSIRGNQRNWNNLKSQQLGVKMGRSSPKNNYTHGSMPPKLAIHKPYRPPMRPNMNVARPNRTSFYKLAHSYSKRPFQRTLAGSSQNNIDDKGYWDSGCSRHMTGNISYLSDYEPFDEGYVSFGQGGCKITGKGTIKTGKLEFENVYFVKDLKYELDLAGTRLQHRQCTCIKTVSTKGSPAQSVGSSNTEVSDLPCLLVLITGTSQSRQRVITSLIHIESCKSPTKSLFDVGSSRISIFT